MKNCLFFLVVAFFMVGFTNESVAQLKKKKKKKKEKVVPAQQPTTLEPYYPKKEYGPKASKGKDSFVIYDAEKRFYDRLEEVAKAKRKAEKEMMKPQYSDPSYFGHKRPPKKNKPGKMKYCKECGIRH